MEASTAPILPPPSVPSGSIDPEGTQGDCGCNSVLPNPVEHEPGRRLRHADVAVELHRRDRLQIILARFTADVGHERYHDFASFVVPGRLPAMSREMA